MSNLFGDFIPDKLLRDINSTWKEMKHAVMNTPEIEVKVLEATSNDPWGPHGSLMVEISKATRNYEDFHIIMQTLWRRMADKGKDWRHVYKSLVVFDFLIGHGSERVVEELRASMHVLQQLDNFTYIEPNGKDQGINVRERSKKLVRLLQDSAAIAEARDNALRNKSKYGGVSSEEYKSGRTGSGGTTSSTKYGGFGSDDFRKDERGEGGSRYDEFDSDRLPKTSGFRGDGVGDSRYRKDEDEDDFDPRGSSKKDTSSSSAKAAPVPVPDLFNLEETFGDVPSAGVTGGSTTAVPDLFGNAMGGGGGDDDGFGAFTDAAHSGPAPTAPKTAPAGFDLFAGTSSAAPTKPVPAPLPDLFGSSSAAPPPQKPMGAPTSAAFDDLFASAPAQKPIQTSSSAFDDFGGFTSASQAPPPPSYNAVFGTSGTSVAGGATNSSFATMQQYEKESSSKDSFKPAGKLWEDTLGTGLVDLNLGTTRQPSKPMATTTQHPSFF